MVDFSCQDTKLIFNYTLDDAVANWEAVQTVLWPRCCLPEELHGGFQGRRITSAHEIVGYSGLVPAFVKTAPFVKADVLKRMCKVLNFRLPGPKQGSGKSGGVIKIDVAKALVNGLFPDESEKEQLRMIEGR